MDLEKFVKLITGKAEFTEQTAVELKKTVEQYPFFSAATTAYLLNLKVIDSIDFENELKKYSIYLGSRRILLEKIIELSKTGLENKKEEVKAKWYDEDVYRNAKVHHDKIMKNIVEPKVEKMRKLSELSSEMPDIEEKTQEAKETVKPQAQQKVTKEEKSSEKQETKPDYEFIVVGTDKKDEENKKVEPEKTVTEKIENNSAAEKADVAKPKQEHNAKSETEIKKEETVEKKTVATDEGIEIDDIFKKIEELKKKKKKSLHDFEHNVNKIDRIVEDQKQREVIASKKEEKKEEPKTETKSIKEETATKQEQKTEDKKVEPKKQEEKKNEKSEENKEQVDDTVIDLTIEPGEEAGLSVTDSSKQVSADEAEEVINLIVEKAKKSKKETATDDMYLEIVSPDDEIVKENKDDKSTKQVVEKEKTKNETPKSKKAEKTVAAPDELLKDLEKKAQEKQKEQKVEPKNESKDDKPKSAADKILEQLAQRKAKRQKSEDLIDKFLTEQPKIDRKKVPEIEGDLSEPSTKEIEIVTEKMAEIYVMQGLYEKAIATYEKLILKKPEKNSYFAQKIKELKDKLAQNEK